MYEFYLDGVRLPVTPGEITMSNGANIDVVDLANGQKITRWIGRDLETITFKASFPSTRYASFVDSELKQPSYYIDKFMGLMRSGTPFQFVMFDSEVYNPFYIALSETPKPSSNKAFVKTMYIQSLQRTESAENGSEVEMEFTLLEWVEKETQTYTVYGKSIDINVDQTGEEEATENSIDYGMIALESFASSFNPEITLERLTQRKGMPVYHMVRGIQTTDGKRRTPTRDEVAALSENLRTDGGFTLYLISKEYFGTYDMVDHIKSMNPHLENKLPSEILEAGTKVKLRDLKPGESLLTDDNVKYIEGKNRKMYELEEDFLRVPIVGGKGPFDPVQIDPNWKE